MQPCYSARRLLVGSPAASVSASALSLDRAQRAHMERVLGLTTIVLFAASVSYIALSVLYGCLRGGGRREPGAEGGDSVNPPPPASEETKRALEGIPVHVVQMVGTSDGDGGEDGGGAEKAAGDCAVCLAEYAAGDEVRVLPACRHVFHRECVDHWLLTRAPTCPICRAPVAHVDGTDTDAKEDCAAIGHNGDGDRRGGIGFVPVAGSRVLPVMWS
ncbi:hypothetical protein ABZP36_035618 [Zizania latifolia]